MPAKTVKKTGAILRIFQKDPAKVGNTVQDMKQTVTLLKELGIEVIHLLVWNPQDEDHKGQGDCGQTAAALKAEIPDAFVVEIKEGDKFVYILNAGLRLQADKGVTHTMILSKEAVSYLTPSTFAKMLAAFGKGAMVAGVHMPRELGNSVLEGRIANTCAVWDVEALLLSGCFDPYSRSLANGEAERPAGVEEIIPLIRLVRHYGKCIAPIVSDAEGAAYKLPTREEDPEEWARQEKKFGSKLPRQQEMAAYVEGGTLEELKAAVMAT